MSSKLPYEDKSAVAPTPRELTTLIDLTQETMRAVAKGSKDRAGALIEQLESAWSRANRLQLAISADVNYPHRQEILVELADALNNAQQARAGGLGLTGILGTPR